MNNVASVLYLCCLFSHLAASGQRACVCLLSITVAPQGTPGPQRRFLPANIIQDATVLAALMLKSIGIHGRLHCRPVLTAPLCPAAAAAVCVCVSVSMTCHAAISKMCRSGNPHHVTSGGEPASVDHSFTHTHTQIHTVFFL